MVWGHHTEDCIHSDWPTVFRSLGKLTRRQPKSFVFMSCGKHQDHRNVWFNLRNWECGSGIWECGCLLEEGNIIRWKYGRIFYITENIHYFLAELYNTKKGVNIFLLFYLVYNPNSVKARILALPPSNPRTFWICTGALAWPRQCAAHSLGLS